MSTICGICRPGGDAVSSDEIGAMLRALDHWGADARGAWAEHGVGLGHLLLRTTPQSLHETLPVSDPAHDVTLTGDLRLDNRAELAAAFDIPASDLSGWPDGRLVLRAYVEWGERCVERLSGDFAFAIWDGRRRRLFCARDRFGIKPFYYYHRGGVLAFATEMKGLFALPFVDRSLDETWIGDCLHQLNLNGFSTLYAGIRRLEQAHTLTFHGTELRLRRYWTMDARREMRLRRDEEYVEAFREHLVRAIRQRVETPFEVGAELSGGLDSSGISAIAQSLLTETGRDLQTFSQVRPEGAPDTSPPDARWAIDLVCARSGITRTHFFPGDGGVLSAVEWAQRHCDEPPRILASLYCHSMYDAAAASGVRVLLSGFGGNNAVSAAAGRGSGLSRTVLDLLLRRTFMWQAFPTRPLRDDVGRRLGIRRRAWQDHLRSSKHGSLRAQAIRLLTRNLARRLETENLWAASRRMEYRYPLLDAELITFYLALPSRLKSQGGTGRYVFRRSLEPWVPDEVIYSNRPRAAGIPGSMLRNTRDEDEIARRLRALPADHPLFDYLDLRKLFTPPAIRGRRPRARHFERLQALMLASRLRE